MSPWHGDSGTSTRSTRRRAHSFRRCAPPRRPWSTIRATRRSPTRSCSWLRVNASCEPNRNSPSHSIRVGRASNFERPTPTWSCPSSNGSPRSSNAEGRLGTPRWSVRARGQYRREVSWRRYSAVRGSVGPMSSSRSTYFWRASSSAFTWSSSAVSWSS